MSLTPLSALRMQASRDPVGIAHRVAELEAERDRYREALEDQVTFADQFGYDANVAAVLAERAREALDGSSLDAKRKMKEA